jgi:hypothetical protein
MLVRAVVASIALAIAAPACAASFEFSQAGTLKIDGATTRSAKLLMACSPDKDGGALSIELTVPEAYTRKDFDYDDFEGPDAEARSKALSRLSWTGVAGATAITSTASGWYAPEPPDSFMFGVSQLSRRPGAPAQLLAAMNGQAGEFEWMQTAFDASKRKLVATFNLDAAAAKQLHDAVAPCLQSR